MWDKMEGGFLLFWMLFILQKVWVGREATQVNLSMYFKD